MIIPFSSSRGNVSPRVTSPLSATSVSVKVALSLSRTVRKIVHLLERLADRLETWARVRSLATGERQSLDTIPLVSIAGSTTPMVATRDARHEVIALTIARAGEQTGTVAGVLS
jgi:hypothetical protein